MGEDVESTQLSQSNTNSECSVRLLVQFSLKMILLCLEAVILAVIALRIKCAAAFSLLSRILLVLMWFGFFFLQGRFWVCLLVLVLLLGSFLKHSLEEL